MVIVGYVESLNFLILLKEKETVEEKRQEHKDNLDSLKDEAKKDANVKEEEGAKAKAEEEAKAKAEEGAKARAAEEAKAKAEEEAEKEVVKEERKKRFWEFWK